MKTTTTTTTPPTVYSFPSSSSSPPHSSPPNATPFPSSYSYPYYPSATTLFQQLHPTTSSPTCSTAEGFAFATTTSAAQDSNTMRETIIIYTLASILVIICLIYSVKKKCKNKFKSKLNRMITPNKFNNELFISNALVAIIAIGEYNKSSLIDGDLIIQSDDEYKYLDYLPIDKDIKNLRELFGILNYKIIPNDIDDNILK